MRKNLEKKKRTIAELVRGFFGPGCTQDLDLYSTLAFLRDAYQIETRIINVKAPGTCSHFEPSVIGFDDNSAIVLHRGTVIIDNSKVLK